MWNNNDRQERSPKLSGRAVAGQCDPGLTEFITMGRAIGATVSGYSWER